MVLQTSECHEIREVGVSHHLKSSFVSKNTYLIEVSGPNPSKFTTRVPFLPRLQKNPFKKDRFSGAETQFPLS